MQFTGGDGQDKIRVVSFGEEIDLTIDGGSGKDDVLLLTQSNATITAAGDDSVGWIVESDRHWIPWFKSFDAAYAHHPIVVDQVHLQTLVDSQDWFHFPLSHLRHHFVERLTSEFGQEVDLPDHLKLWRFHLG